MDMVDRIEAAAREKGSSITALERDMGVSSGTIKRYRRSVPGIDKIMKIAEILGVRAGWQLDGYEYAADLQLDERELNLIAHYRARDLDGKARVEAAAANEHDRVKLAGDNAKAAEDAG